MIVETPSGKHAGYENFPVGSWLLPAKFRPHIATFYNFARTIDDIADTPTLSCEEKLERLDGFAQGIKSGNAGPGFEKATAMAASLRATGISEQHCLDLVNAFRQDALQSRYDDWQALMDYCLLSAAPVGRYLIDLHGGGKGTSADGNSDCYGPSDALCCALQIINHVQDCGEDYRTLDRVYLPRQWMGDEGMDITALGGDVSPPELRAVLERILDATDDLLAVSRTLSARLSSRRLGLEASVIQHIAETLGKKLRHEDPLAKRVSLGRFQFGICGVLGIFRGAFPARNT